MQSLFNLFSHWWDLRSTSRHIYVHKKTKSEEMFWINWHYRYICIHVFFSNKAQLMSICRWYACIAQGWQGRIQPRSGICNAHVLQYFSGNDNVSIQVKEISAGFWKVNLLFSLQNVFTWFFINKKEIAWKFENDYPSLDVFHSYLPSIKLKRSFWRSIFLCRFVICVKCYISMWVVLCVHKTQC